MTGLEKITARIQAEGRERAGAILQEAEQACTELARDFAIRTEQERTRIRERAMREGEAMVAASRESVARTERRILQEAKTAAVDRAFDKAREELCSSDFGKYRELLSALLVCALLEQDRAERESLALCDEQEEFEYFEVLMNSTDRERFGNEVIRNAARVVERRIGAKKAGMLRLARECADIDGGVILRYGRVELNCSLSTVLRELRDEIEERVAHILFASGEGAEQ